LGQLGARHVVALGDVLDLLFDFLVGRDDRDLLSLLDPTQFLHLDVLVDQRTQGFLLQLGQVLLGRLQARGDHQQAHALHQVVAGDDVVVDDRRDAFRQRIGARAAAAGAAGASTVGVRRGRGLLSQGGQAEARHGQGEDGSGAGRQFRHATRRPHRYCRSSRRVQRKARA
jgi:hypothetical protein